MDNIKVAIKVRPLIDREKDDPLQWNVSGNTITPMDSKRRGEAGFQFDHIFDMQKKNTDIFNTVVKPIVNSAVNGFNGTVFAYGQTGSGKTHTMMGTETENGIIPQAINYMFEAIESKEDREFLIRFSYFEIYNERINDLMEVGNTDLKIKEENGKVFVKKCSEKITKGSNHMLTAMRLGEKNRRIGETYMNERSSRSHTIFRITIESREISNDSDGAIHIAQLNLVDLAGSERASQTGATGDRFKEGKHINLSLSTLGLVIKQLSETQDKDKPNFVNFRDSKLTRILQASLGGNSLTAIICTVTPATFEETYCTLLFASRAKSIKNKPKLNEDLSEEALLKRYKKQIIQLTKELEKANQTIKDRQNNVLAERVELLKEYIVTGNRNTNFRRRSCPVKFNLKKTFFSELPTIRESLSPETPKIEKIKRRQSIMQNANSSFETFETALADFELNLLHSDLPPVDELFISHRRRSGLRSVNFNDNIQVFNETDSSSRDSAPIGTPRRLEMGNENSNCRNDSSPGTPEKVLRERLKTILEEHMELEKLTVLEKQCNEDESHSINVEDKEKTLQYLKKSLEDMSLLYTDVNKKYSNLQTEHSQLAEECGKLRKQVVSLSAVQAHLGKMEIENKDLSTKLTAALKKQSFLKDENRSQAFQMESLQKKFKAREKELESSLKLAWEGCDSAEVKETAERILQLQTLVKSLTEEIEVLKLQKSPIQESNHLTTEIESLKLKLEETNRLLKESDFEKASLLERLDSISQRSVMTSKTLIQASKDNNNRSIEDLESKLTQRETRVNELVPKSQELEHVINSEIKWKLLEEDKKDDLEELNTQQNSWKELEFAKFLIIKQMKFLSAQVPDSSNMSISDLFLVFLETVIFKGHEIIETLMNGFDQEKLKLKESIEQSEDAEKRATKWAKALEFFVSNLQSDMKLLESKNVDLQKQIEGLEIGLEETQHENQSLKEKIGVLEGDYNALQAYFEKYYKGDMKGISISEEKERILVLIKDKEMELQSKMKQEKEELNKKLGNLIHALKTLETENLDLKNNVDGYKANEKQLKNIIDIKNNEISKNNQKTKDLQIALEQLVEAHNKLSEEIFEKNNRIEEITSLLKSKCDILSEYKKKLETLMPEYDHLCLQIKERKLSVKKYKEEIENLRAESRRELNLFKDKFAEEEIKSAGLNKLLNEMNNKNSVLLQEIDKTREKCMELEMVNEKLMTKVRSSTSNMRVAKEIEELMGVNRILEKNLGGASNLITDLLDARTKIMKNVLQLEGEVETVKRENEDLKKAVDTFKLGYNYSDIELRGKYEELVQETNGIKVELEEKELILTQRDKKLEEISEELRQLKEKNEELDKEAEELAEVIRENETDIAKLSNEKYDLEDKCKKEIEDLRLQLKHATSMNAFLKAQIEIIRRLEVDCLLKENKELKEKIVEVEHKLESKSCTSSRNSSPLAEESKRKKRRSDLFNQKRNLDDVSDSGMSSSSANCACSDLRKTVAELQKEVAMKNGVIAALNVQIQSENFPYQKKCKELHDQVIFQKDKSQQLVQEISNLKKTTMDTSANKCEICKNWRLNQRDQSVQCKMEEKVNLCGTSSRIADQFKLVEKLEKEKVLIRQLCRSRVAQIKQLEIKVAELSHIKLTK